MTAPYSDFSDRNYTVNIGQYFSRGLEIFKQFAGGFIGYALLVIVISVVLSRLPESLALLGSLVSIVITPLLTAGYYYVAFNIARNRAGQFGDFFQGFSNFLPLFLVNLVSSILIAFGLVLLIIPGIYLAVAYTFAMPFVVDKHLEFWSAMETSRRLITRQWFSFLGLGLLLVLLNIGGALLLGIGLLVTLPLTFCIITAAYEDIVGLNSVADPTM